MLDNLRREQHAPVNIRHIQIDIDTDTETETDSDTDTDSNDIPQPLIHPNQQEHGEL